MKEKEPKNNKPDKSQRIRSFSYPFTAVGIAVLLILSPWVLYLYNYQSENNLEEDLELNHHIQEAIDSIKNYLVLNATELIERNPNYNSNLTAFESRLNENLELVVSSNYQPYLVPGKDIEIMINYYSIELKPMFRTTHDLIRYPRLVSAQTGLEIYTPGTYQDTSVPYSYSLRLTLQLTGRQQKDENGGDAWKSKKHAIVLEEILPIPHLFIEYKLQQFQAQGISANSDLARMMRYMLTTLARLRVHSQGEFGPGMSHKNILSEGDIELTLNLAILLEEALLLRAIDTSAVDSVDQNFYSAIDASQRDNPTGKRQWGTAEISNYYDYTTRRSLLNNQGDRLLQILISKYVNSGYIDPADLMALYLVLDKAPKPAIIDSSKDTIAILEEEYDTRNLMDPRTPDDASDTTNLKFILSLPDIDHDEFGLNGNLDDTLEHQNIEFIINQEPNYLILDADFKLQGLNDARGWYSTAPLRQPTRTRTSSVVKERPADHDYRLEWKLDIQGKFNLNLGLNNYFISPALQNIQQTKTINLDLPINVYIWFIEDPIIESVDFIDFNSGGVLATGNWEITSESHLVEYFEKSFWSYLKPFFGLGFDSFNTILPLVLAESGFDYYYDGHKKYLNNLLPGNNPVTANWITDFLLYQSETLALLVEENHRNFRIRFNTFMADYFLDYLDQYGEDYGLIKLTTEPQFPHPPFVPWLSALGYEVTLLYNSNTDIMNITILLPDGYYSVLINGYNSSINQLDFVMKCHLELPELIKLDTTVSSNSLNLGRPSIFSEGLLFNRYQFSTQAYSKPVITTPDVLPSSNDQLLFTRSKFGTKYKVTSLELQELSISSNQQDISVILTFFIPEDKADQKASLENSIKSINLNRAKTNGPEAILEDRIYVSQIFSKLSDGILSWLETAGGEIDLAIDLSIESENPKHNQDYSNITFYLTELTSMSNFISWLGENGLDLVLLMGNHNSIVPNLGLLLSQNDLYFTPEELVKIDIEMSNRVLDHELQKQMNLEEIILNQYQFNKLDAQNLTVVQVIPGRALADFAIGLSTKQNSEENSRETYSQVFYCYQPIDSVNDSTYLLVGTSYLVKN
jgi:hypothetical protein